MFSELPAADLSRLAADFETADFVHLRLGIAEQDIGFMRQQSEGKAPPMRNSLLALAAAAMTVTALPAAWTPAYAKHNKRQYYSSANGIRYWRGNDGRYYCRRANGTTGLIVGGAVGALAGRAIDTRGERATGTILGAAAGALIGREVSRGRVRCN